MLDDIHALTVQCWWQDEKINAEVCAVCSVLPCLTFSDKDKQDVYDWLYNPTTVSPDISARLSAIMGIQFELVIMEMPRGLSWQSVVRGAVGELNHTITCMYGDGSVGSPQVFLQLDAPRSTNSSQLAASLRTEILKRVLPGAPGTVRVYVLPLDDVMSQLFCLAGIAGFRVRRTSFLRGICGDSDHDIVPSAAFNAMMRWLGPLTHGPCVKYETIWAVCRQKMETENEQRPSWSVIRSVHAGWARSEIGKAFAQDGLEPLAEQLKTFNFAAHLPYPCSNSESKVWAASVFIGDTPHIDFQKKLSRSGVLNTTSMFYLSMTGEQTYGIVFILNMALSGKEVVQYLRNVFTDPANDKRFMVRSLFPVFPAQYNFYTAWIGATIVCPLSPMQYRSEFLVKMASTVNQLACIWEKSKDLTLEKEEFINLPRLKNKRGRQFCGLWTSASIANDSLFRKDFKLAVFSPAFYLYRNSDDLTRLGRLYILNSPYSQDGRTFSTYCKRPYVYSSIKPSGFKESYGHVVSGASDASPSSSQQDPFAAGSAREAVVWSRGWTGAENSPPQVLHRMTCGKRGAEAAALPESKSARTLPLDAADSSSKVDVSRLVDSSSCSDMEQSNVLFVTVIPLLEPLEGVPMVPATLIDPDDDDYQDLPVNALVDVMPDHSASAVEADVVGLGCLSSEPEPEPAVAVAPLPSDPGSAMKIKVEHLSSVDVAMPSSEPEPEPAVDVAMPSSEPEPEPEPAVDVAMPSSEPEPAVDVAMPSSEPEPAVKIKTEPFSAVDVAPPSSEPGPGPSMEIKKEPLSDTSNDDAVAPGPSAEIKKEPSPDTEMDQCPPDAAIAVSSPGPVPSPGPVASPGIVPLPAPVPLPDPAPLPLPDPQPPSDSVPLPLPDPAPLPLPDPAPLPQPDPVPQSDSAALPEPDLKPVVKIEAQPVSVEGGGNAQALSASGEGDGNAQAVSAPIPVHFSLLGVERVALGFVGRSYGERSAFLGEAFQDTTAFEDPLNVEHLKALSKSARFFDKMNRGVGVRRRSDKDPFVFEDCAAAPGIQERVRDLRVAMLYASELIRVINAVISDLCKRNVAKRDAGEARDYADIEELSRKQLIVVKKARILEEQCLSAERAAACEASGA